uniref:Uncharacterized protein n=1 Tax=Lactuca sativa TaxID=4236 RepID=A0A9R1X5S9_LACSA|nr:hypothetical protein LSAT_V11C600301090 [Lactuca sativa]
MWIFGKKGESGFSSSSTAEEVTHGIDGSRLTAIVTGATGGIGAETARVLALRGVHVVMAVRNTEICRKVKENILTESPDAKVDIMELDLSSQASVRDFATRYRSSGLPLHILMGFGAKIHALEGQNRTTFCNKSFRSFSFDESVAGDDEDYLSRTKN